MDAVAKLKSSLAKQYGDEAVVYASEIPQYEVASSGSLSIDQATGIGGLPHNRVIEIVGPEGVGKGHDKKTRIATPDGWRMVGDLCVGDEIFGSDGTPTKITGIFPRGEMPIYRVTMTDRSSVVCDIDHLWKVKTKKTTLVLSIKELLKRSLLNKDGSGRYKIPMVSPVQYDKKDLKIEPYLLGVLLANGYLKKSTFTTNDVEIPQRVQAESPSLTVVEHRHGEEARRWYVGDSGPGHSNIVMNALKEFHLFGVTSRDKFIPDEYASASVEQRVNLLQGLMDCDGTCEKTKGKPIYTTYSQKLAEGMRNLVESLGGTARTVSRPRENNAIEHHVYVSLPSEIEPFSLERKLSIWKKFNHRGPIRCIKKIEKIGFAETVCLRVAAEDHLYVTENYIVTHNTTLGFHIIKSFLNTYPDKIAVLCDLEHRVTSSWLKSLVGEELMERILVTWPDSAEEATDMYTESLKSGVVCVFMYDSIGGSPSQRVTEKSAQIGNIGGNAQAMTRFSQFAAIHSHKYECLTICINQIRDDIAGYNRLISPGGHGLKHCYSLRLWLKPGKEKFYDMIDGEKVQVGGEVFVKVIKNSLASPYKSTHYLFYYTPSKYGFGIDTVEETIRLGILSDVIHKAGRWYNHPLLPGGQVGSGAELLDVIRDNAEIRDGIVKEIMGALADHKVSGVTTTFDPDDVEDGIEANLPSIGDIYGSE